VTSQQDAPGTPAYRLIQQELRAMIARGEYQQGTSFTTQREICERFGVSMGTAVRALNELVGEGVLVRRRGRGTFVAEAAERTRPTGHGHDATIALIVHGEGPHQSDILKGIASVCDEHGYRLFVSDSTPSPGHEERALQQALDTGASGVVLYARQGPGPLATLAEFRRRRVPVVLVDRYLDGFPTDAVFPDHFATGHLLTEELISQGHQRIATLWSEHECSSVRDRSAGYVQALREQGIAVRPDFMVMRSYLDLAEAERRAYLSSILELPEPPTALLCANGPVLATAAHDLLSLGVGIPDTIDLAGMDNAGPFDLLPLACVAAVLPSRDMGIRAAEVLMDRIGSEDPYRTPQHHVLPVDVRVRESALVQLRPVRP
jgi:DNA-binding LacI/PurR family transcriptional regulator